MEDRVAITRQLAVVVPRLVDGLHCAVGNETEPGPRRWLLHLKRDVFNARPPRGAAHAGFELPADLAAQVAAYTELLQRRDDVEGAARRLYVDQTPAIRNRFKALLASPDFQKGLLLSSRSLFSRLPNYLQSDSARPSGREEHIERGLLRYFTRASRKATPFGTFCAVVPGRFVPPNGGPMVRLVGDPSAKQSQVRLNKTLYAILLSHLKSRPAVRKALVIARNPTIEPDGDRFRFLTGMRGHEVFQRLDRNGVLDLITRVLDERPGCTTAELISELDRTKNLEATQEEVFAYLDQLVMVGFLRFCPGIREQDPDWDIPLRALLVQVDDPHASRAAALLADLRAAADAFGAADVDRRAQLVACATTTLAEAMEEMGVRGTLGRRPLLYEDASAAARCHLELDPRRSRAVRDLISFVELTGRLSWPRVEQATMRRFFEQHYGGECRRVPLLTFYEDYYREHFKGHLERQQAAHGRPNVDTDGTEREEPEREYDLANPFQIELVARIQGAHKAVREIVAEAIREAADAEEVRLQPSALEEAIGLPVEPVRCRSLSLFVQVVPGYPNARLLLPGGRQLAGFGKYFSRFLYVLPTAWRAALREGNRELSGAILAEICGDAAFNANLHPPLVDWEISYPTGEGGSGEGQLSCAALAVQRDPEDLNALSIVNPDSEAVVLPLDLGFLNPRMRPPLFQMLSLFGPRSSYSLPLPPMGSPGGAPVVTRRPRLVFGECLILTRRSWHVPGQLFPRPAADQDGPSYMMAVDAWRRAEGIPDQVYVRVLPGPVPPREKGTPAEPGAQRSPQEPPAGRQAMPSRDFLKPQFIDFCNPLLVGLFARLPGGLDRFALVVEECLPADGGLGKSDEHSWATEMVFQLDMPAPSLATCSRVTRERADVAAV